MPYNLVLKTYLSHFFLNIVMSLIKDIMTWHVVVIGFDHSIFEAAQLMTSNHVGCLVIMDGETIVGIVTERDIVRRAVAEKVPLKTKVSEVMSKHVFTVNSDASIKEAAKIMSINKIRRLPVLEQNKLVGIIVGADIVRHLGKKTVSEQVIAALGRDSSKFI
jgi:CBS domain-containing protein